MWSSRVDNIRGDDVRYANKNAVYRTISAVVVTNT